MTTKRLVNWRIQQKKKNNNKAKNYPYCGQKESRNWRG
jgi:hypothetical protein